MRATTKIKARLENVGRPQDFKIIEDSAYLVASGIVKWMRETTMQKALRITVTRPQMEDSSVGDVWDDLLMTLDSEDAV